MTRINWDFLLNRTTLYAANHVNRWRWRGSLGGVLPDGFDPNSIASQAIADLLIKAPPLDHQDHFPVEIVQRQLERRVRQLVNRLHHRVENHLLRNEPDLAPVTLDDDEVVSVIHQIPDEGRRPDRVLLDKEDAFQFYLFKVRFSVFLGRQRRLLKLFQLYCRGFSRPEDIAAQLKLHPSKVLNLRKRFIRRWVAFHQSRNSPQNGH